MYKVSILLVLITNVYHNARLKNRKINILFLMSRNDAELFYPLIFMIMVGYGTITI